MDFYGRTASGPDPEPAQADDDFDGPDVTACNIDAGERARDEVLGLLTFLATGDKANARVAIDAAVGWLQGIDL